MLKTLIKNEMFRLCSLYFYNSKKKTLRSTGGIIGMIVLFLFIFASVSFAFVGMSEMFISFAELGLSWFYFLFFALVAIGLGTIGSVFFTYSGLYQAKDNEFLLSLPIRSSKILFVRMLSIYGTTLIFEAIPLIPSYIVYWIKIKTTPLQVAIQIVFFFILGLLILGLTCLLGFVVAIISTKLKNKTFITVFLIFGFLGAYYFVYFKINSYLQLIVQNVEKYSNSISKYFFLLQLGELFTGKIDSFLIISAISLVFFALVYFILSISFIKIVTNNSGAKKTVYVEKKSKTLSIDNALLKKEFKRFFGSVAYLTNCGFSIVIMIVGAVYIFIKSDMIYTSINNLLNMLDIKEYLSLFLACAVSFVSSTIDITAPSISLEGKNLWILQTSPIKAESILKAKLKLHYILSVFPIILVIISISYALKLDALSILLILLFNFVMIILFANLGLALNLKVPNFDWENETVPVKQGFPIMICFFGGWFISLLSGAGGYFIKRYIYNNLNITYYFIVIIVIFSIVSVILRKWNLTKGSKIFEKL